MPAIVVCALYKFTPLDDLGALRQQLLTVMRANGVRGTFLLAAEGINGTMAGTRRGVDGVLAALARQPGLGGIMPKEAFADAPPFRRARVKIRREIVTLGVAGVAPAAVADGQRGVAVTPHEWHALLDDDATLVVDVRNAYEVAIGSFGGAVNPDTATFRDFPAFVDAHLKGREHRKIAMFCTGGVRCEKATVYLKQRGFDEVFQLRGGILGYLNATPPAASRWQGECFVFDDRVAVDGHLKAGNYAQCHACRAPLSAADRAHPHYARGASCPHCHAHISAADRARFLQREKQMDLAAQRGQPHLGPAAQPQLVAAGDGDDAAADSAVN